MLWKTEQVCKLSIHKAGKLALCLYCRLYWLGWLRVDMKCSIHKTSEKSWDHAASALLVGSITVVCVSGSMKPKAFISWGAFTSKLFLSTFMDVSLWQNTNQLLLLHLKWIFFCAGRSNWMIFCFVWSIHKRICSCLAQEAVYDSFGVRESFNSVPRIHLSWL